MNTFSSQRDVHAGSNRSLRDGLSASKHLQQLDGEREHRLVISANDWIDLSLLALLLVAPLFMGGRHALGEWVYILGALPAALALTVRSVLCRGSFSGLHGLLLLVLVVPLIQSMPQVADWITTQSHGYQRLMFSGEASQLSNTLGSTSSLVPSETMRSLPLLAMGVVLFLAVRERCSHHYEMLRIVRWYLVAVTAISVLALVQAKYSNAKFMWLYDHPTRDPGQIPRGPFQNENHLCHLVATSIPLAIYFVFLPWIQASPVRGKGMRKGTGHSVSHSFSYDQLLGGSTLVAACALVYATPSRGGFALVIASVAIMASLWLVARCVSWGRARHPQWIWFPHAMVTGYTCFFLGIVGGIFWLMPRLSYWRAKIYAVNWQMFQDFPLLGTGLGTHRYTYRAYLDEHFPQTFTHAESSIVQILSETGALGGVVLIMILCAVGTAIAKALDNYRESAQINLVVAFAAAVLLSLFHACFDFPWHIPACAVPVIVLVAMLSRLAESPGDTMVPFGKKFPARRPEGLWRLLQCALPLILLLILISSSFAHYRIARAALAWDDFRRGQRAESEDGEKDQLAIASLQPLQRCLAFDPNHVMANVRLAQLCVTQAKQLAEPERRKRFLMVANSLGEHVFALCPTQAESVFVIAETRSLQTGSPLAQQALFEHALKLRPIDGRTLTQLALAAMMRADEVESQRYWYAALHQDPAQMEYTLTHLTLFLPPSEILTQYQPPLAVAEFLLQQQAKKQPVEQLNKMLAYVADAYVHAALNESRDLIAEQHFGTAYHYASQTYDVDRVIGVLEKRVARNPGILTNRLMLIDSLLQAGQREAVGEHLAICERLAPQNPEVRRLQIAQQKARVHGYQ